MDINDIKRIIPAYRGEISWADIERGFMSPFVNALRNTKQNPEYHGEIDVWSHTKAVCEELVKLDGYREADGTLRCVLFVAALLHDIGKISRTHVEDGIIVSPRHSPTGAKIAREYLLKHCNLCGDDALMRLREAICLLIRYHTFPLHALEDENAELKIRRVGADGELAPYFTVSSLITLSRADMLGRISGDKSEKLGEINEFEELAGIYGCLDDTFTYPDTYTEYCYLSGKKVLPQYGLFDITWGEVIMMCGLPGVGKDTWIKNNYPELPTVCPDDIRREYGLSATGDQTKVFALASEQAKHYLRRHIPFIWNATSLDARLRAKHIELFASYGASVRLVYLETSYGEELSRNENREHKVPKSAIDRMISGFSLPERREAHKVEWICT